MMTAPTANPRPTASADAPQRRAVVVAGATGLVAGALGLVAALARFVVPGVLYEPPRRFPVGRSEDFAPGSVSFVSERRVFIVSTSEGFYAVSAVCTHLGCNVSHDDSSGFACPCHGSTFAEDGSVKTGPAPWPLPHYAMTLSRRGELVVDTRRRVPADFRLKA